ncbi:phosphoribosylformylglycinamidine cyclo-ligase [Marinitoga hydrogenitolerans DSM 16785]|uniref:Phosphoribosylformylglycinamidine cyclo-ligase n=1 Tax=Marinitoga hydrogenitolerans (strain DSM 16785 / JCM 12826 / AT1271) TaxID=1122195 RepID=A0A1M4YUQ7_MARH1|nr:phosphoribosylformylglycinamidine cyclo-ligase [Marinitoga hydrogenitolerans]SHF09539.1 phosphoribosylformylglycinamidine cyclo-ligase [Marinitoga hydrogenitolerans DSM 16785]
MDYKTSGVNIDEANKMISGIKDKLKDNADMYAGIFPLQDVAKNYENPLLVASTDGVGTKMVLLEERKRWDIVARDLVGMVLNDLVCIGAKPLFFLDYYATGKLDSKDGTKFLDQLIKVLNEVDCKLIGGETAELPGLLVNNRVDVAGFGVGIVEKKEILGKNKVKEGDILIGLRSNGIHSNGYSLVRKLLKEGKISFFEELISPTKLMINQTLKVKKYIHAAAHITGGGIEENLLRVIPDGLSAKIVVNWEFNNVFKEILNAGISLKESFKVFNMGIGMIYILDKRNLSKIKELLPEEEIIELGKIVRGEKKVKISF